MSHRLVTAGDVQLAVREYGPTPSQSASVLLVHGLSSNSLLWHGAATELARLGYHVVAVDLRGHGLSSKPDTGYDIPTVSRDLAMLIESLGLCRPVVVGQSWGGNVVLELAYRHPGSTRGVCCVDGGLIALAQQFKSWEQCAQEMRPPPLAGIRSAEFQSTILKHYSGWPEAAISGTLACMQRNDDGTMSPWLTLERHMLVLRGLWEHAPHDTLRHLQLLKQPVLFTLADSGDDLSKDKRENYERAASDNDVVRIEWFAPAHHDLHAQFPERWAALLHAHISNGFFA